MAFKKYTQCYNHTPGDRPFNEDDLIGFAMSSGAGGLLLALFGYALGGGTLVGSIGMGIAYAQIIVAVANEWLFHRLACVSGVRCAVGRVAADPHGNDLGDFDNDEMFDVMLMPHRLNDDYRAQSNNYLSGLPGLSLDGLTELTPANDIYLDGFQGEALMKQAIMDLGYKTDRAKLHCEAEGNFWVKMKEWALALGIVVTVASAAGAAAGGALGCAILGIFGPLGCLIGAIIGAIIGAAAATAVVHIVASWIAFNADPGDIDDANVGDRELGPIREGDKVVVLGEHVYDGFHEGWHELHPLMAVMKMNDEEAGAYLEWDPEFPDAAMPPPGLTRADMRAGLASATFRARAVELRDRWCGLLTDGWSAPTRRAQLAPGQRWTIHPTVDGCKEPIEPPE